MTDETPNDTRRTVLKTIGAGLLAGGLASGTATASEPGTEYEFTPPVVGLPEESREELGLPEPGIDSRNVETTTTIDGIERSVTRVERRTAYRVGDLSVESADWSEPRPEARGVATFVTPHSRVAGTETNDLATVDVGAFLREEIGSEALLGVKAWERPPEAVATAEIEVLERETELRTFAGIAASEAGPRVVLAHVVRVDRPAEVVFGAAVQKRRPPDIPDPLEGPVVGEDRHISEEMLRRRREFGERSLRPIRPDVRIPCPSVDIQGASLVQRVGDSGLADPSGGSLTMKTPMDDPALVVDDYTTVSMDLDPKHVGWLSSGDTVRVEVLRKRASRSTPRRDTLRLDTNQLEAIARGTDPMAIFHDLANKVSGRSGPPVFELPDDLQWVRIRIGTGTNASVMTTTERIDLRGSTGRDVVECRPLRVGFVEIKGNYRDASDPPYGNSNGRAMEYDKSVTAGAEYLDHAFPGRLTAYKFTKPVEIDYNKSNKGTFVPRTRGMDLKDAGTTAQNRITSSSPAGTLVKVAEDRTPSDELSALQSVGFDAVVAIAPNDDPTNGAPSYNGFYGQIGGLSTNTNRDHAVLVPETGGQDPNGGNLTETDVGVTAGHEVAHKLGGQLYEDPHNDTHPPDEQHPFAQRRVNDPNTNAANMLWGSGSGVTGWTGRYADFVHARHVNSDYSKSDSDDSPTQDPPGIVSDGYDLADGDYDVVGTRGFDISGGSFSSKGVSYSRYTRTPVYEPTNSLLSYHPWNGTYWPDARICRTVVTTTISIPVAPTPVITVDGRILEEIRVDQVDRVRGIPDEADGEGNLTVERLNEYDEVIGRTTSSTTLVPHDGESVEGVVSVTVPADGAVWLRLATEEFDTRVNALVAPLRSAVEELPAGAFAVDPEGARDELQGLLDDADAAMRERRYGNAIDPLVEAREVLSEAVDPEFEGALNDPTLAELLDSFDRALDRLESIAG